ncbi:MAG: FAD-binding oxidoreductase [Steroidobacteraceae bacterium]|jgi:FAD/FMN-containing dehydrogenase|nr:FAD-binding oxidoreductase [Steroidobacteraceae bacterium]
MDRRTLLKSGAALGLVSSVPGYVLAAGSSSGPAVAGALTDLAAVRGDRSPVVIGADALRNLRASLRGRLLLAADPGYDEARQVLNGAIDRRPALIVQPTGAADVCTAVSFASSLGLLVAVKCGGHSYSGQSTCDGGLQIDLGAMRGVRVDPTARRAWVAGGTLLGAVDHEALAQGLAAPLGTVSHTGVGGLTTGGGFGRLARRFGLALDNVTSVDIVTADGTLRRASRDENPDLYWAVRGGGGNFGVVTAFEFQLHPVQRTVIGGTLVFPVARARELLQRYAEVSVSAPDELYVDCFIVQPAQGTPSCGFDICWSGPERDAERVLAPLRKVGTPVVDRVAAINYAALQRSGDVTDPRSQGSYTKSGFTTELSERTIDAILRGLKGDATRNSTVYFQHLGGAIGRVAPDATAFPFRYARQNMMVFSDWKAREDGTGPIAWVREYWKTLEPATRGVYINEMDASDGAAVVNANFLGNYPRLAALKRRYDPANLFRLNANITPS